MQAVTLDLTKNDGCYAKYLADNIESINQYANNDSVSRKALIEYVLEVIRPAYFNKEAKPRFTYLLMECTTKRAILNLCFNAIANAAQFQTYSAC